MKQLIKYTILVCSCCLLLLSSCSKDDDIEVTGNSKLSITNAATEAPALDAYIDNEKITTASLAFGATSVVSGQPYFTINAGLRFLRVSPDGVNNFIRGNVPFSPDSSYSVFVYDSVNAAGTLKALMLRDVLTAPASGKAHYRYLQLSPDKDTVNIQLVNSNDTIRVGNKAYIGANANASSQDFIAVNPGTYTLNVRKAGTDPIIYSTTVSLGDGKIYTIYSRGKKANGAAATGFNISSILHN